MSIRISNSSVSTVVRGYAHTQAGLLVWLEMAPQHPKVVGAIRAEMTSNTQRYMQLRDDPADQRKTVHGLGRGYLNLTADAPQLAVGPRAKAQLLRMIAPDAVEPEDVSQEFYVLSWPDLDPATVLAAMLERYAPFPVQIGWGAYLLQTALDQYDAEALVNGGQAPSGYVLKAGTPWADMICEGLRFGQIQLVQSSKRHAV